MLISARLLSYITLHRASISCTFKVSTTIMLLLHKQFDVILLGFDILYDRIKSTVSYCKVLYFY